MLMLLRFTYGCQRSSQVRLLYSEVFKLVTFTDCHIRQRHNTHPDSPSRLHRSHYTVPLWLLQFFFFLFMSDAHHGINSSTQKYQSTQSSVVLTSCRQDSDSPPF